MARSLAPLVCPQVPVAALFRKIASRGHFSVRFFPGFAIYRERPALWALRMESRKCFCQVAPTWAALGPGAP